MPLFTLGYEEWFPVYTLHPPEGEGKQVEFSEEELAEFQSVVDQMIAMQHKISKKFGNGNSLIDREVIIRSWGNEAGGG